MSQSKQEATSTVLVSWSTSAVDHSHALVSMLLLVGLETTTARLLRVLTVVFGIYI